MRDDTNIKSIVKILPNEPGVYQYFDKNSKIIYIGKAKNLKKRVSSYFKENHENYKTAVLVKQICNIEYIVVETEQDALLLENNLIKKYQPRYNVLLKDDKTFPWICIKNEPFPRVFYTRKVIKDGSLYFGPFTSMFLVSVFIDLFRQTYKLRTCSLNFTGDNVSRGKFKVCLQYHIGNCLGPCENKQTEDNYKGGIEEIKSILRGNIGQVIQEMKKQMKLEAESLNYEEAHRIKVRLEALQNYQVKSTVVSPSIRNIDIFSFKRDENLAYINFLKVINGSVIHSFTLEIKERVEESDEDLLLLGITDIRTRIFSNASEMIVPFKPSFGFLGVKYTVPLKGEKKSLLELSEKNVSYYILEKKKSLMNVKIEIPVERILSKAQTDLRLNKLPIHIECFDNSNLQGTNPVAACVVFKNAKPSKRDYRHFIIKSVEGPDDFSSMKEVVYRRYKRLKDEDKAMPDLVIVDGGKGQLSAALEALDQLGLRGIIAIIGIAKRLEEIYFPGDPVPLYINKNSETLKLIQKLRDEAHRFGISHHRDLRSKKMVLSELDSITGIGSKTKEMLFSEFKSVEDIKEASQEALQQIAGKSKGTIVFKYFNESVG